MNKRVGLRLYGFRDKLSSAVSSFTVKRLKFTWERCSEIPFGRVGGNGISPLQDKRVFISSQRR